MRKIGSFIFSALICSVLITNIYANGRSNPKYFSDFAFIIPMPDEAKYICDRYFNGCNHPTTVNNIKFYFGSINHHHAVLAISGVGMVNTAVATTVMVNQFDPKYLAMFGSSGGIDQKLKIGDVVIGGTVYDYNFGHFSRSLDRPTYTYPRQLINPNNGNILPLVYGVDHQQRKLLPTIEKVVHEYKLSPLLPQMKVNNHTYHNNVLIGTIADSSTFPTSNLEEKAEKRGNVDVVAFEDTAFLQTCWIYQKTCFSVRSVSNMLPGNKNNTKAQTAGMYSGKVALKILLQLSAK